MPKRPLPKMALFSGMEWDWWRQGSAKKGKNNLVRVVRGQTVKKDTCKKNFVKKSKFSYMNLFWEWEQNHFPGLWISLWFWQM